MSESDFGITADMAEISRMRYELDYTEGISQQMRIPDRLKVGPDSTMGQAPLFPEESHSTMMQVPDRIVVAGIPPSNGSMLTSDSDFAAEIQPKKWCMVK